MSMQWTYETMWSYAQMAAKARLFRGYDRAELILTAMLFAESLGRPPIQGPQMYHPFRATETADPKLTLSADAMRGLLIAEGGSFVFREHSDERCAVTATYRGTTVDVEWSMAQARRSGLVKARGRLESMYETFPRQMLAARTTSEAVRLVAPHLAYGLYTPEEMADIVAGESPVVRDDECSTHPVDAGAVEQRTQSQGPVARPQAAPETKRGPTLEERYVALMTRLREDTPLGPAEATRALALWDALKTSDAPAEALTDMRHALEKAGVLSPPGAAAADAMIASIYPDSWVEANFRRKIGRELAAPVYAPHRARIEAHIAQVEEELRQMGRGHHE